MIQAVKQNDLDGIDRALRDNANPNAFDDSSPKKLHIIHIAVIHGDFSSVKKLIDSGASPDATDEDGKTATMYAAEKKNLEILMYLCEQGRSHIGLFSDKNNDTIIDYAQKSRDPQIELYIINKL
ncbi:MAG: ankyrin repeat domain-containing protein [Candidatus Micrarchaeota archaeon]|nr:ankyrin repeat domain-containing protein [Candidatus Micrarchaeota archaeon]